jgi:hypothetical protein
MAKLLTNYGISAKDAHEMALEIRNTITQGMDSIWRERNSAQHQPKDRREINEKITTAFEKRERLGIDSSPHHSAEDLHKLPFRTKANWLANSEVKIHEREENNKRKTAATKALAEGKSPAWHKGADKGQPHKRQQQKPFTSSKGNSKGKKAQLTVKSPWDNSPMAAARGSLASAQRAQPAAPAAAGAAAAAAADANGEGTSRPTARPSTADTVLTPSTDLERSKSTSRETRSPPKRTRTATTRSTTHAPTRNTNTAGSDPATPEQDNDPDNIDDVV